MYGFAHRLEPCCGPSVARISHAVKHAKPPTETTKLVVSAINGGPPSLQLDRSVPIDPTGRGIFEGAPVVRRATPGMLASWLEAVPGGKGPKSRSGYEGEEPGIRRRGSSRMVVVWTSGPEAASEEPPAADTPASRTAAAPIAAVMHGAEHRTAHRTFSEGRSPAAQNGTSVCDRAGSQVLADLCALHPGVAHPDRTTMSTMSPPRIVEHWRGA